MKSNFFKLCSMFLCGAMFAFAGCSDLEKDIQQVSGDVDAVEVSVADLQAALDALEAAQEKMAQDYALKADLEKAQKELQSAFDSKTASLQALVDELNETVLTLDANKASKADVDAAVKAIEEKLAAAEADLKATLENINKALEGKANAEDLASAVAAIDILKNGYSETTAILQNLAMALEGKASQEEVDSIVKDLATLKDFYQKTTEWITNTSTAIEALQNGQEDMAGEIEDLQTASAQLTLAATNLQGSIDGILGRVEVLEEQVEKINDEIDALKEQLKNDIQLLNEAFMEKDVELEQKIAINKQAIADLTEAVSLLTMQVQNLSFSYELKIAEYDEAIETIVNTIEQLENVITSNNAEANQKIAWLQTQLDELKAENEKLVAALETLQDKTLGDLNTEIMNQISALEQADKDILANIESIEKALEGKIEAAKLEIASVKDLVNDLINDINGRLQSLVFVPSHSDLNATSYPYSFLGEPLNNEVIVKATYQVTPITLAYEVGQSLDVAAALQPVVPTRAAADKYVWAKNVIITDVSPEGKFDVDIIFDAEEYLSSAALALYVQHPDNVMADDVDPEMSVEPTPDVIVRDYMSSSFVGVKSVDVTDLDKCFVLAKKDANGKFVEYARTDDQVEWSDKDMNRAPFAGYDVMIKLDDEYLTIAEAAEFLHVDAAMITPNYAQESVYGVACDIKAFDYKTDSDFVLEEEPCEIHTITDGVKAWDKTYGIEGEITPKTAVDYVGHRITVYGQFYFGNLKEPKTVTNVIAPIYTYTVDYREANLNLVGVEGAHYLAWNYETAVALSENRTPNMKDINAMTLDNAIYSEYAVVLDEEIGDINYKEVMEAGEVTYNSTASLKDAKIPELEIVANTNIISDIAKVQLKGDTYKFYNKEVEYNFEHVYTDYNTFTRIVYTFDFTLGAKPDAIPVSSELELAYTNKSTKKEIEFAALTTEAFADYLPKGTEAYTPFADASYHGKVTLEYGETLIPDSEPGTVLRYSIDEVEISAAHINSIYTDADADKKAVVARTVNTWFEVDFEYAVNVTVTDPAYYISVLPTYVGVDNNGDYCASLNYTYSEYSGSTLKYTVDNANMAHYFKVNGNNTENEVRVHFTIVPVEGATTTPIFKDNGSVKGGTSISRQPQGEDGSFIIENAILEWGDYEYLTADVVAQLYVNDIEFGPEVVVTLYAQDPLSINGKTVSVKRVPNKETVVDNVLAGADVTVIGWKQTLSAADFAADKSTYQERLASTYDAKLSAELVNVYYYENGEKVALPTSNYTFDGTAFTLAPESSTLLIPVYAEFKVEMDYTLDGGVAKTTTATYKFEYSK